VNRTLYGTTYYGGGGLNGIVFSLTLQRPALDRGEVARGFDVPARGGRLLPQALAHVLGGVGYVCARVARRIVTLRRGGRCRVRGRHLA